MSLAFWSLKWALNFNPPFLDPRYGIYFFIKLFLIRYIISLSLKKYSYIQEVFTVSIHRIITIWHNILWNRKISLALLAALEDHSGGEQPYISGCCCHHHRHLLTDWVSAQCTAYPQPVHWTVMYTALYNWHCGI